MSHMDIANPPRSSIYRTAEVRVGGNMAEWLQAQRDGGTSFQYIAGKLAQKGIIVSHETVRAWCTRLGILAPAGPVAAESPGARPSSTGDQPGPAGASS